jgi:hypothetical protein
VTTSRTPIEHVEGECTGARETRDGMPAVGSKYVRCMCHGKERLGGWCMGGNGQPSASRERGVIAQLKHEG